MSSFKPTKKKKLSKAIIEKMNIDKLKAKYEKNCLDKRYYFPNMPVENSDMDQLRSLGDISEETASEDSEERGTTFRSKPFMTHRNNNNKFTLISPPRMSKLDTLKTIQSPRKIVREFKLPSIINSPRRFAKDDDEESVRLSQIDTENDDTRQISKAISLKTIMKGKPSLLDLHISDPNRHRRDSKLLFYYFEIKFIKSLTY
jgi:hypothetical protein